MPMWHSDLKKRKTSGGKRRPYRTKKSFEAGSYPTNTRIGNVSRKDKKAYGGLKKPKLLRDRFANVTDPRTGKTVKVEIQAVVENPASVDYDRRKIITRGAVIKTAIGEAVVASRPGQHGMINAILKGEK